MFPSALTAIICGFTDFTDEQKEFQETARQFTRDVVIPAAPELDRTGEVCSVTLHHLFHTISVVPRGDLQASMEAGAY